MIAYKDAMGNDFNREIEQELDLHGLRNGLLLYTRKAYELLPHRKWSRILDIGCGRGEVTLELARLTSGDVIGIDIDETTFFDLRATIESEGLGARVIIKRENLFDVKYPDHSFNLIWEEGTLHLLDSMRSIATCSRLLKPGGFLVLCETVDWFEGKLQSFGTFAFELAESFLWPKGSWWTDYYEPLEKRIGALREKHGDSRDLGALCRYENEIRMVKADPERFDCGHFFFYKGS